MRYEDVTSHSTIPPPLAKGSYLRGSSSSGLLAAELLLAIGLDGELGLADSRDTLDSSLTEVGAVTTLGSLVGNRPVAPIVVVLA